MVHGACFVELRMLRGRRGNLVQSPDIWDRDVMLAEFQLKGVEWL